MEEVQKNEPGRQPEKEKKPKRELSPKEVQRRRKMIVFPLMFLAFAGCMYLIFAPSGKEKTETESVGGFNADIPLPAEDGIIADKQTAYEQAMMNRKRQGRIQSLQDFGFIGDEETEEPQAEAGLMPEEDPKPVRGGGASSSATAYRDINRQLSTFYETPPEDMEKEDLKRQVAELTEKLERQREATPTVDEQMALLEKSYELAAKYAGGDRQAAQVPVVGDIEKKPEAVFVQAVRDNAVSGLQQPMSDADFIRAYSQPRNYGFNTAVGTGYAMGRNTIAACIHQDQTLTDGQTVKLRLLEPMQAGNIVIPKNTLVAGTAKVQGGVLDRVCGKHHPGGTRRVRHGRAKGAFRPVLDGAGSVQRGDGEYRQRAGYKHFLYAERWATGGDGRYKGADAGCVRLPCQEVPNRESEAESRVQGDALCQTAIII